MTGKTFLYGAILIMTCTAVAHGAESTARGLKSTNATAGAALTPIEETRVPFRPLRLRPAAASSASTAMG